MHRNGENAFANRPCQRVFNLKLIYFRHFNDRDKDYQESRLRDLKCPVGIKMSENRLI